MNMAASLRYFLLCLLCLSGVHRVCAQQFFSENLPVGSSQIDSTQRNSVWEFLTIVNGRQTIF